jgi:DNA-binding XRE family transcriptional regulator
MATVNISKTEIVAISKEERTFFVQLGARVAELRKARAITQVQLAESLAASQQTVNAYELGRAFRYLRCLPSLRSWPSQLRTCSAAPRRRRRSAARPPSSSSRSSVFSEYRAPGSDTSCR